MFKVTIFLIILGISIMGLTLGYDLQAADNTTDANRGSEYVIGPGDQLEVSVWNHPELTRTVRIRPDGKISLPLIENINADGITPSKLSENIRDRLSKYIKEPQVSVIVMEYKSKNILIIGDVAKPGLYQYEGNMTVFDAIGMAGGYGSHAELKSILVVRGAYYNKPRFYIANLYKAIHNGDITENVMLQPKDIVFIPKNFIGNVGDFTDFYLSKIVPAASAYLYYKATD